MVSGTGVFTGDKSKTPAGGAGVCSSDRGRKVSYVGKIPLGGHAAAAGGSVLVLVSVPNLAWISATRAVRVCPRRSFTTPAGKS